MDVLGGLPNTFEELNQGWCFNHTIQLLAKALLKPFYSAGLIESNDDSDDGIALQAMDDNEEKEEEEEEDEIDDEDKEEEEDPLDVLDDNERENLMKNTEAVRMTPMKVHLYISIISLFLCSCCYYRFANSPSPLSILLPSPFLHGMRPAFLILFVYGLSLAMSKLNGILHLIS